MVGGGSLVDGHCGGDGLRSELSYAFRLVEHLHAHQEEVSKVRLHWNRETKRRARRLRARQMHDAVDYHAASSHARLLGSYGDKTGDESGVALLAPSEFRPRVPKRDSMNDTEYTDAPVEHHHFGSSLKDGTFGHAKHTPAHSHALRAGNIEHMASLSAATAQAHDYTTAAAAATTEAPGAMLRL